MTQMPPPGGSEAVKPHRGAVILVLGILGLVICFILGIVAWMMANTDLREMDAGRMDPEGRGLTQAGKICGIISVILAIIGVVFVFLVPAIAGAGAAFGAAG